MLRQAQLRAFVGWRDLHCDRIDVRGELWHPKRERQVAGSGHLVVFDRREGESWEERVYQSKETEGE